ncbi:unnamed protein product [Heligmosomoides polygyrus]|uniref:NOT2_3_5 domain-containing protein n=1 Tax=Heligmosomoides polygyrus TaxID=6339 RepID=A0A183G1C5_HELPZ|nr:unnamed protein product [Heligmosomoides polygyrus]
MQRNVCREQLIGLHPYKCRFFLNIRNLYQSAHVSRSLYVEKSGNETLYYAPMGALPAAMFNDVFTLRYLRTGAIEEHYGSCLIFIKDQKFWKLSVSFYALTLYNKELKLQFKDTIKPQRWKKHICEMGGYKNLDFIVWMRPVSNSNFKKLHRTLENVGAFKDGLPQGVYRLEIENSMFLSLNPRIKSAYFFLKTHPCLKARCLWTLYIVVR